MAKPQRKKGQALVELIVTLFAFFTVLFLFVQVGISLGIANYLQYVTFMAGRALLSGAASEDDQKRAANSVIEEMLSRDGRARFQSFIRGEGGNSDTEGAFVGRGKGVRLGTAQSRDTAWEQGVTYKFRMKLNMMPFVRARTQGGGTPGWVTMESQSWLGRDPSDAECMTYLRQWKSRMGSGSGGGGSGASDPLFDNGC